MPAKRSNPVPRGKYARQSKTVQQGLDLYRRFRDQEPGEVIQIDAPKMPKVLVLVGTLDTVEYTTERNGKIEYYRHEFREESKPLLCAAADGSSIVIVGGHYDFTEVGIADK